MTTLHCEIGNHSWERESQRGRPPKNCPDHQSIKDKIKIKSNINPKKSSKEKWEELLPGVSIVIQEQWNKIRTYHCEHDEGHDWEGESKRGRPPRFCPEHRELYSEAPKLRGDGRSSKTMQKAIERIINSPGARSCHCGLNPSMNAAEIRALNGGCCEPSYVCPTLDTIRRTLNL